MYQIESPTAAQKATEKSANKLQVVVRKPATRPVSPAVIPPWKRDQILNLAFQSTLRISSFRHIARLADVTEETVFRVVRANSKPTTPPMGRAA
jgi:hypothetical protein